MLFCSINVDSPILKQFERRSNYLFFIGQRGSFLIPVLSSLFSLPHFSFFCTNPPSTLPDSQSFPHWSPDSITHLFSCPPPFCFKIPQATMAARALTRTTVARGCATSMAECSRRQTTPTPTRPTRSVFTSWKVKQGPFPFQHFIFRSQNSWHSFPPFSILPPSVNVISLTDIVLYNLARIGFSVPSLAGNQPDIFQMSHPEFVSPHRYNPLKMMESGALWVAPDFWPNQSSAVFISIGRACQKTLLLNEI